MSGGPSLGLAGPVFRRLAHAAVLELDDDAQVVALSPEVVAARDLRGKVGAVVVELAPSARPDDDAVHDLARRLAKLLGGWMVADTSLVVVGPADAGQAFAREAEPAQRRGRLHWTGVDGDGVVTWGEREKGPLAPRLDAALRGADPRDWGAFEARIRRSADRAREQHGFARRLSTRRPWATWTLVAANVAFFGVEVAVAGTDPSVRALVRLGGVVPRLVHEGEVWRLVSGAFLHGSPMHLAFNAMVLLVLGSFVERLLGPARFLVLYAACAVAGAVASIAFMDATVSVGASGALWGILAAEGVLAFAPGFLPSVVVPAARRTALLNLGLNVAASTLPHIDWAAHAGGGVTGALLVWLVLSRGVPRGEALASGAMVTGPGLRAAAALAALLLAAGAVAGPVLGGGLAPRPTAPDLGRVALPAAGVSLEVPRGLTPPTAVRVDDGGRVERAWGDPLLDPVALGVAVIPLDAPLRGEALEAELAGVLEALGEPPTHGEAEAEAAPVDPAPPFAAAARATYRYPSGLRHEVFVGVADRGVVRADVYHFPEDAAYADGLARRVAESARWDVPR